MFLFLLYYHSPCVGVCFAPFFSKLQCILFSFFVAKTSNDIWVHMQDVLGTFPRGTSVFAKTKPLRPSGVPAFANTDIQLLYKEKKTEQSSLVRLVCSAE